MTRRRNGKVRGLVNHRCFLCMRSRARKVPPVKTPIFGHDSYKVHMQERHGEVLVHKCSAECTGREENVQYAGVDFSTTPTIREKKPKVTAHYDGLKGKPGRRRY